MDKLTDWISVYDDAIPSSFCDQCIELFENPNTHKGEFKESWRRCKELVSLDSTNLWTTLKDIIKTYYNKYKTEHSSASVLYNINTVEAPLMFRYDVNNDTPNIFNDHSDNWNLPTSTRQVSIILYLNDVEQGGGTNFTHLNLNVKPKKGSILFFPSFYNFVHRGDAPLSNSKYIIVTWLHYDGNSHTYRVHKL